MNIELEYIDNPNLIVRPIRDDDIYDPINIDERLPQHPFLAYAPAPCSSGKSTVIQWLLVDAYYKFFNRIYVISSTIHQDMSWKKFQFDESKLFEYYTDGVFKQIVQELKETEDEKALIIIDDMTCGIDIWKKGNELTRFIPRHRHFPKKNPPNICGTSLFIISHQYKSIPKVLRGLMSDIILFEMNSQDEVRVLSDDNRGLVMTHQDFLDLYMKCIKDKYSFLYIKKKEQIESRFRKNFNTIFHITFFNESGENIINREEKEIEQDNTDKIKVSI